MNKKIEQYNRLATNPFTQPQPIILIWVDEEKNWPQKQKEDHCYRNGIVRKSCGNDVYQAYEGAANTVVALYEFLYCRDNGIAYRSYCARNGGEQKEENG